MDATTCQVMAVHVGDRSRTSAKRLWATRPGASRRHATLYTDHSVGYAGVMPAAQHRASRTLAWKTSPIERCHTTLRQRVSHLVREALSFSKQLANHSGAMQLCIGHDNRTRAAASSEPDTECTTEKESLCMSKTLCTPR